MAAARRRKKEGFYPFTSNPQEENPARGYIVSANFQPVPASGIEIPGYYNLADRGQQLNHQLSDKQAKWDIETTQKLQLGTTTAYGPRLLAPLLPVLREVVSDPQEQKNGWNNWLNGRAITPWTPPVPRCSTSSCSIWPTRPCTMNWAMASSKPRCRPG
nr:hypothetical protein GCM10020185_37470 [Pseudomonas brassicacearum subsp. brassicacearum]